MPQLHRCLQLIESFEIEQPSERPPNSLEPPATGCIHHTHMGDSHGHRRLQRPLLLIYGHPARELLVFRLAQTAHLDQQHHQALEVTTQQVPPTVIA